MTGPEVDFGATHVPAGPCPVCGSSWLELIGVVRLLCPTCRGDRREARTPPAQLTLFLPARQSAASSPGGTAEPRT